MLEDIKSFTSPSESMLVDWRFAENELFQRFVFSRARLRTYPMVLVDYERRPYTSAFDLNFRITFDSHLRATATSELFPSANKQWFETLAGHTVLEVKFHRRVPAWFHRIIKNTQPSTTIYFKVLQGHGNLWVSAEFILIKLVRLYKWNNKFKT